MISYQNLGSGYENYSFYEKSAQMLSLKEPCVDMVGRKMFFSAPIRPRFCLISRFCPKTLGGNPGKSYDFIPKPENLV